MVIRITHREDHPQAGYHLEVRFHDPARPVLRLAAATAAGVQLALEHLFTGRHPGKLKRHRDCTICRATEPLLAPGRSQPQPRPAS